MKSAVRVAHHVGGVIFVAQLGDGLRVQDLPAVHALLVFAAFLIGGGFLVHNPVAGGVARGQFQDGPANRANLGLGAGGLRARGVAGGVLGLQAGQAAAGAGVLDDPRAVAGRAGDLLPLVPGVAQRVGIVGDEAGTASLADMQGAAAGLATGSCNAGFIVVRQGVCQVGHMAVAADRALLHRVTGAGATGLHGEGLILVLAFGGVDLFHGAAALANFQGLAGCLTSGVPDDYALPSVSQGVHIVGLLHLAALYAQPPGVTQGGAGGFHLLQLHPVVALGAGILAAIPAAVGVLAVAVGVAAAAGAAGTIVVAAAGVHQADVGHPILHHIGVVVGVGDLVVHGIAPCLGVVRGTGEGTGFRALPIADLRGDTGLREVGNGDGVGLAVHYALVVGHHGFRQDILGLVVFTVLAAVHDHEPVMG